MNALENNAEPKLRYYTREDLMFIFGVAERTIDEWQSSRSLPCFKVGRVVRYPAAGVFAWARARTLNQAAAEGRAAKPEELEQFWLHIERMVSVVARQIISELQHPNHLEAA